MKAFFQIGTNDGNDEFRNMVISEKPDLIILVEPNSDIIDLIKQNYSSIDNVNIYNKAIYYKSGETVELAIPSKEGQKNTDPRFNNNHIEGVMADNGIKYSDSHFSLLPMGDWGSKTDMVTFPATTITFDDICDTHNITEIELLMIDTEGFDYEILRMIDLNKYKIKKIVYEIWPFDPDKAYPEKTPDERKYLGCKGLEFIRNKLETHGYSVQKGVGIMSENMIATI